MSIEIHRITYRLADGRSMVRIEEVFSHFDFSRNPPAKDFQRTIRIRVEGLQPHEVDEYLRFYENPWTFKVPEFLEGMVEVTRTVEPVGGEQ